MFSNKKPEEIFTVIILLPIGIGLSGFMIYLAQRDLGLPVTIFCLSVIGLVTSGIMYFDGLKDSRFRRKTENIPTCKIKTGAVGTDVEVNGKVIAEKENRVKAPITGKECVLYHLNIQVRSDSLTKGNHWVTRGSFFSDEGFFLDDDSGAYALVLVEGANIHRGETRSGPAYSKGFDELPSWEAAEKITAYEKEVDTLPAGLVDALEANREKLKKFSLHKSERPLIDRILNAHYMFKETRIDVDEHFYIRGFADSGVKKEKLEKYAASLAAKTKMIFKSKQGHPLFISNNKEKELVEQIGSWAEHRIVIAVVLAVTCLAYQFWFFKWG